MYKAIKTMTLLVMIGLGAACSHKTFVGGHFTLEQRVILLEAGLENQEKLLDHYRKKTTFLLDQDIINDSRLGEIEDSLTTQGINCCGFRVRQGHNIREQLDSLIRALQGERPTPSWMWPPQQSGKWNGLDTAAIRIAIQAGATYIDSFGHSWKYVDTTGMIHSYVPAPGFPIGLSRDPSFNAMPVKTPDKKKKPAAKRKFI